MSQLPEPAPIDPAEWLLIQGARDGDHGAFERLLSQIDQDLNHFFKRESARSTRFSEAELKAEAEIKIWSNLHKFKNQYRFRSYAFGIAMTTAKRLSRPNKSKTADFTALEGKEGRLPTGELPINADSIDSSLGWASIRPKAHSLPGLVSPAVYYETLIALMHYGGYPHQQIAFAFSLLGWGEAAQTEDGVEHQKVPISGDPDRVVRELSSEALIRLFQDFRRELEGLGEMSETSLDEAFEPVDYRLTLLVRQLFEKDATSRRVFEELGELQTSWTRLEQYFGKNPRGTVAEWTAKVKDRVRSVLVGRERRKSLLPFPAAKQTRDFNNSAKTMNWDKSI